MKVERVNTDNGYMVSVKTDDETVEIQLSMKDALALADMVKAEAMSIIEEANQIIIIPKILKTLIECGKVDRLHYSHTAHNEDTGLELFSIRAVFTDNSSRSYFHECKFSDNPTIRKAQMDYAHNIPIYVDPIDIYPGDEIDSKGRHGYNIIRKEKDPLDVYVDLVKNSKPKLQHVDVNMPGGMVSNK